MTEDSTTEIIENIVRGEWGRVLSILASYTGDIGLSEDVMQDAFIAALTHWRTRGIPTSPRAWLLQTARRKAIDRLRRDTNFERKRSEYEILLSLEQQAGMEDMADDADLAIPDERLRLVFTCCHPALSESARIALTLRTLGGLTTPEIARAFLVTEETMAQRLVRAKKKIRATKIPYEVPGPELLPNRLQSVLSVLYLIFNEGYAVTSGSALTRTDLCDEAIRLGHMLTELMPDTSETRGLLALMLLHDARKEGRTDISGAMVPLIEQNRALWDKAQIDEGVRILKSALATGNPGPYQIQAAISAIHAEAKGPEETDWQEIALLYGKLYEFQPSPIVELNAAVAWSYADGPEAGLRALSTLEENKALQQYQPFYAAKADIYRRAGQQENAKNAYKTAISLTTNATEKDFLIKRLTETGLDVQSVIDT